MASKKANKEDQVSKSEQSDMKKTNGEKKSKSFKTNDKNGKEVKDMNNEGSQKQRVKSAENDEAKVSIEEFKRLQRENELLKKRMGLKRGDDIEGHSESQKQKKTEESSSTTSAKKKQSSLHDRKQHRISTDDDIDHHTDDVEIMEPVLSVEENDCGVLDTSQDPNRAISPIEWDRDDEEEEEEVDVEEKSDKASSASKEASKEPSPRSRSSSSSRRSEKPSASAKTVKRQNSGGKVRKRRDRRSRSPINRLPRKIKFILKNARYFLIKSVNHENISIAKERGVWATPRSNEERLTRAFHETRNVILCFSVSESGRFQGYARVAAAPDPRLRVNWVLPRSMDRGKLSPAFKIDWLSRAEVSFAKTNHLVNLWNEQKPVKIGRDGQEIEPSCGEFLCRIFPLDATCALDKIINKARRAQRNGPMGAPHAIQESRGNQPGNWVDRRPQNQRRDNFRPFAPPVRQRQRNFDFNRRDPQPRHRSMSPPFGDFEPGGFINGNFDEFMDRPHEMDFRREFHEPPNYRFSPDRYPPAPFGRRGYPRGGMNRRDNRYENRMQPFPRGNGRRGGGRRRSPSPSHSRSRGRGRSSPSRSRSRSR